MALYQKINVTRSTICVEVSCFYEKVHDFANFGGCAAMLPSPPFPDSRGQG